MGMHVEILMCTAHRDLARHSGTFLVSYKYAGMTEFNASL